MPDAEDPLAEVAADPLAEVAADPPAEVVTVPLLEVATAVGGAPDPLSATWTAIRVACEVKAVVTIAVVAMPEEAPTASPDAEHAAETGAPFAPVARAHPAEAVRVTVTPSITVLRAPTSWTSVAPATSVTMEV